MVPTPVVARENTSEVEDEYEEAEQPIVGPSGTARVAMVTGNVTLARTRSASLSHSAVPFH